MATRLQTLRLAGKKFVVLEQSEYERLCAGGRVAKRDDGLPPLPPADADGNRPALEYVRVSIARDLIRERKTLGLTQQELARLAGIRQETLSRLESAKHAPTVGTLAKIERALKRAGKVKGTVKGTK
jgi:DNA-binding XRE family transcriptional regulator